WPLVDVQVGGMARRLAAPSPRHLVGAAPAHPLYSFVHFAESEASANPGLQLPPPSSLRGEAYEEYLGEVAAHVDGFFDLRLLDHSSHNNKRPDFVWIQGAVGVLFEAKFSLRPSSDVNVSEVGGAVAAWSRCCECVDQAREFLAACPKHGI